MTDVYDLATHCRVCRGPLVEVLNLGEQCLGGHFPLPHEDDPPRAPLVLCRCAGDCGLVQLGHFVDPEALFRDYFYQSGVTTTMWKHLNEIAWESQRLLGERPERILDIGCNDGTLLNFFPRHSDLWGIDPAIAPSKKFRKICIRGFFPEDFPVVARFDLIFSVACFYDANDPVRFAKSVAALLAPAGLWCLEVANWWDALATGNYDGICHEHVCYYSPQTIRDVVARAGLRVHYASYNFCNGGSQRLYLCRKDAAFPAWNEIVEAEASEATQKFVQRVQDHREMTNLILKTHWLDGKKIHLLGASTKANTVLQYCDLDAKVIAAASDRDPRKHGRVTPGTRIPIVSEEESRSMRPDVYVTVLGHFREELLRREEEFLRGGGSIVFLLPCLEEVRFQGKGDD